MIFFTKNPNKKNWGRGRGRGLELIIFFTKNPNLKYKNIKKKFFWVGGWVVGFGGGGGWNK